jgi:hypothetical protein
MNHEEKEASRILDLVKMGDTTVPWTTITWALWTLGDAVGLKWQ